MKNSLLFAPLLFSAICATAFAATDHAYYVTEVTAQQKFDVYNDGHNTFLQSIPGLVVTGATADGEYFIVKGTPPTIRGFLNGKPITVVRGIPAAPKPPVPDTAAINARLEKLSQELANTSKKLAEKKALAEAPPGAAANSLPVMAASPAPPAAAAAAAKPPANAGAPAAARPVAATAAVALPPLTSSTVATWHVQVQDENLRLLIDRWSQTIGWTSVWDVDRDIPIDRGAKPVGDFKTAVRYVLASTELGDVQLKPCFYSNNVIRVVRKTTKCNPTE